MQSRTSWAGVIVSVLAIAGCSGTPETMLSPTAAVTDSTAQNPDGSNLKVTAPANLSPNQEDALDTVRPTLTFSESVAAVPVSLGYDLEIRNASGAIVYQRSPISPSYTVESDLNRSESFTWRVRARLGDTFGPWSGFATFRTPAPPQAAAPSPGAGSLPFAIPAECGPGDPSNRLACVLAMAARSAEWTSCSRGNGVGCHRFTRQVVYALSQSDPNYRMIQAAPGGHACNCFTCGPSDGSMFREDTTVYGGNQVYDMVGGAGGPSPSLGWSRVPGPRSVDTPASAPLCAP